MTWMDSTLDFVTKEPKRTESKDALCAEKSTKIIANETYNSSSVKLVHELMPLTSRSVFWDATIA